MNERSQSHSMRKRNNEFKFELTNLYGLDCNTSDYMLMNPNTSASHISPTKSPRLKAYYYSSHSYLYNKHKQASKKWYT